MIFSTCDVLICMEPHYKLRKICKTLLFKVAIISVSCVRMYVEVKYMIRAQRMGADKWVSTVV